MTDREPGTVAFVVRLPGMLNGATVVSFADYEAMRARAEADAPDAARWRHARHHALVELLSAYPTCDTCDVGLDYAVDAAIAEQERGG